MPWKGKFWIYETVIRPAYYAIYEVKKKSVEVYRLFENHHELMEKNDRDRFSIDALGVELGIWNGTYCNVELPWLRWWDSEGNLLLTGEERAERERQEKDLERQRADRERQRADRERERADRLAQLLRENNINPDEL